jgi:hypothetical protein
MPYKDKHRNRVYQREWQRKKRATGNASSQIARQKRQALVDRYKRLAGCTACGISEPVVLTFHHIDPDSKTSGISEMTRNAGMGRLKAEIRKCIVICSNCHKMLHAGLIDLSTPA